MKFLFVILFLAVATLAVHSAPVGHLQRMGSHRPSSVMEEVQGFKTPKSLYYDNLRTSTPVIFRGATKEIWSAVKDNKWSDEYITRVSGHTSVTIELDKKETRLGEKKGDLKTFVADYRKPENADQLYVIAEVPKEMLADLAFPREFRKLFRRATHPTMWFSSGGTKSFLHKDDQDNFNCAIDGLKEFVMIDKAFSKEVYESDKYAGYGTRCPMDCDAVDLEKYPLFQHVPWYNVTLQPGDCLFIPNQWFHQVRSHHRSISINLWFRPPKNSATHWFTKTTDDVTPAWSSDSFAELAKDNVPLDDKETWVWQPLDGGGEEDEEEDEEEGEEGPAGGQEEDEEGEEGPAGGQGQGQGQGRREEGEDNEEEEEEGRGQGGGKAKKPQQPGDPVNFRAFYGILKGDKVLRNRQEAEFLWTKVYKMKSKSVKLSSQRFDSFDDNALKKILKGYRKNNKEEL